MDDLLDWYCDPAAEPRQSHVVAYMTMATSWSRFGVQARWCWC